jgi:hypothetical protein
MVNKTIVIGDIHGRDVWKKIVEHEDADKVIFIGDYFDSFDIPSSDQINNFLDIIEYKKSSGKEVILLIGNHDYHYMRGINETYSGYKAGVRPAIEAVLEENKKHLQMVYQDGEFLFSHAGVSEMFLNLVGKYVYFDKGYVKPEEIADDINEIWNYKPTLFGFGKLRNPEFNIDPYGDNQEQSPIWIRPRSLMNANYDTLRKEVIQVVGHTQIERMDIEGKATGNRYYFIDCLGTSGQYLIIENNVVTSNSYKNYE